MEAYLLEDNLLEGVTAWKYPRDILSAVENLIEKQGENRLSITISTGTWPEDDIQTWPVQRCECGVLMERKLYTNTCLVCGNDI